MESDTPNTPPGSAYVGVWRMESDTRVELVGATELPPADVGAHVVNIAQPIAVEPNDFVGIFYPRSTRRSVIAQAGPGDVRPDELYQVYQMEVRNYS